MPTTSLVAYTIAVSEGSGAKFSLFTIVSRHW